jgi:hypothetical protein
VTVVLVPTRGTMPGLVREVAEWADDAVDTSFDRAQVREHASGGPVRAWVEITRPGGEIVHVSLSGPFALGD